MQRYNYDIILSMKICGNRFLVCTVGKRSRGGVCIFALPFVSQYSFACAHPDILQWLAVDPSYNLQHLVSCNLKRELELAVAHVKDQAFTATVQKTLEMLQQCHNFQALLDARPARACGVPLSPWAIGWAPAATLKAAVPAPAAVNPKKRKVCVCVCVCGCVCVCVWVSD